MFRLSVLATVLFQTQNSINAMGMLASRVQILPRPNLDVSANNLTWHLTQQVEASKGERRRPAQQLHPQSVQRNCKQSYPALML